MPNPNLVQKPFLDDYQETELSTIEHLVRLAAIPDQSHHLSDHIDHINSELAQPLKHVSSIMESNGSRIMSMVTSGGPTKDKDLEALLQFSAFNEIGVSHLYDLSAIVGSIAIGANLAEGGDDADVSSELTYVNDIILSRARHDASTLIGAASIVMSPFYNGERPGTLWEVTDKVILKNPKLKTVKFNQDEASNFVDLQHRLRDFNNVRTDVYSPSRIPFVNLLKSAVKSRQLKSQSSDTNSPPESWGEIGETLKPVLTKQLLELSEEEITEVARFTNKINQYVQSAARVSIDVAMDPRARYFSFLKSDLTGIEVEKEKQALSRRIATLSTRFAGK